MSWRTFAQVVIGTLVLSFIAAEAVLVYEGEYARAGDLALGFGIAALVASFCVGLGSMLR